MKRILSTLALMVAGLAFSGTTANAQNGSFAPYVSLGVSAASSTGINAPSFNASVGIESSSRWLLADVNGNFSSNNPVTAVKACVANGVASSLCSGYSSGISAAVYAKVFKIFLVGGGATWDVNPATLVASAKSACTAAKSCVSAVTTNANPFVGGGVQFKHDRLLVSYVLPGLNAIAGQKAFNVHNEIMFSKLKHVRFTQDVSFITGTGSTLIQGTMTSISGTSAGVGLKLVL